MRRALLPLSVVVLAVLAGTATASAATSAPWSAAGEVRTGLFDAQTELILGGPAAAGQAIGRARGAAAELDLAAVDPAAAEALDEALTDARAAARARDSTALAAARGAARGAILRGSYVAATTAAARGDARIAAGWLLVRELKSSPKPKIV